MLLHPTIFGQSQHDHSYKQGIGELLHPKERKGKKQKGINITIRIHSYKSIHNKKVIWKETTQNTKNINPFHLHSLEDPPLLLYPIIFEQFQHDHSGKQLIAELLHPKEKYKITIKYIHNSKQQSFVAWGTNINSLTLSGRSTFAFADNNL